tara:strand:- start:210 stop:593 length:384 start_codon:yes stop_codon:yes gene_type:complete
MSGLSPKLPVTKDPVDGFALTHTFKEMIHQNFKNLILTSPGERVMDPNFGVGIRSFLFQQMSTFVFSDIEERIMTQVSLYIPFVQVTNIWFNNPSESEEFANVLDIRIEYLITPIGAPGVVETRVVA